MRQPSRGFNLKSMNEWLHTVTKLMTVNMIIQYEHSDKHTHSDAHTVTVLKKTSGSPEGQLVMTEGAGNPSLECVKKGKMLLSSEAEESSWRWKLCHVQWGSEGNVTSLVFEAEDLSTAMSPNEHVCFWACLKEPNQSIAGTTLSAYVCVLMWVCMCLCTIWAYSTHLRVWVGDLWAWFDQRHFDHVKT